MATVILVRHGRTTANTSGILAGRRDLIASALLQQLDMDVSPDTWTPPRLIDRANLRGVLPGPVPWFWNIEKA